MAFLSEAAAVGNRWLSRPVTGPWCYRAGEAKLKDAYAGIEKQNEALTNLVAQRDDLVQKYNDEVKDRNDIVAKYNDLAKQFEKLQSGSGNSADK